MNLPRNNSIKQVIYNIVVLGLVLSSEYLLEIIYNGGLYQSKSFWAQSHPFETEYCLYINKLIKLISSVIFPSKIWSMILKNQNKSKHNSYRWNEELASFWNTSSSSFIYFLKKRSLIKSRSKASSKKIGTNHMNYFFTTKGNINLK